MVDGAAQRFPADGRIYPVQLSNEITRSDCRSIVVSAGIRDAEIKICRLGDVAVSAEVLNRAHIAPLLGPENCVRITTENLPSGFQKYPLRGWDDSLERNSGVIDSVFPAHQVCRNQRTIHPGKNVIMHQIDFAECGTHFADFGDKTRGQRGKRYISLLKVYAFFSE